MGVEYINPFGTKGALLYSPDGSMCVLRSRQPGRLNVRAVLRHFVPYKGVPPLRCHSSYPSALCSRNSLLAVLSRIMRKFFCRLQLNEVSRQ